MPYFFDTNIILGYLFYNSDTLGAKAVKRVEDKETNHTGYTTYKECFGTEKHLGKSQKILQEISDELRTIKYRITENGIINFRNTFSPKQYPRTGHLIYQCLTTGKITDTNIETAFKLLGKTFVAITLQQKRKILDSKVCSWHPKREEPYSAQAQTLREKIENTNDIEVLLDAYHIGKTITNLILITADKKDILNNKDHILKTLPNFREIIPP